MRCVRGLRLGVLVAAAVTVGACSASATRSSTSRSITAIVVMLRFDARRRSDVEAARIVVLRRLSALGVPGAKVDLDFGRDLMLVRLPGERADPVSNLVFQTGELRFRPVLAVMPYASDTAASSQGAPSTCRNGTLITPPGSSASGARVVLADLQKTACFVLGPTLIDGTDVDGALAVKNPESSQWQVDIRFRNNDFVTKVAVPYVHRQIAIELDGVVQSAPVINPGITGRDVTISGTFTQTYARALALALQYGALPVHLHYISTETTS